MKDNTLFLVVGIILVLAIIGVLIFGIQTSGNITTNRNDITTLKNQVAAANSSISTLTDQLNSANAQISSLKTLEASDVTAAKAQLATITDQLTSANNAIAALKTLEASDVSALKSQLGSLPDQISALNTQLTALKTLEGNDVTGLKTQVTTLQTTLTSLQASVTTLSTQVAALSSSSTGTPSTLFSSVPVTSLGSGGLQVLYAFAPTSSGTIYVTGSSTSGPTVIRLTNNNLGTYTDAAFGTGTTVTFAVYAGVSYSISFINNSGTVVSASLTGTFTPTASSATTLFSNLSFTHAAGAAPLLFYAYSPTTSGTFYVSGTATFASTVIRITDTTAAIAYDRPFGTGTTVVVSGIAGHVYNFYAVNSDVSGTNYLNLTGQYY
jgi:hypothetical protein